MCVYRAKTSQEERRVRNRFLGNTTSDTTKRTSKGYWRKRQAVSIVPLIQEVALLLLFPQTVSSLLESSFTFLSCFSQLLFLAVLPSSSSSRVLVSFLSDSWVVLNEKRDPFSFRSFLVIHWMTMMLYTIIIIRFKREAEVEHARLFCRHPSHPLLCLFSCPISSRFLSSVKTTKSLSLLRIQKLGEGFFNRYLSRESEFLSFLFLAIFYVFVVHRFCLKSKRRHKDFRGMKDDDNKEAEGGDEGVAA